MAFNIANFTKLCERLAELDLFGADPKIRPKLNSASAIKSAITNGAAHIPIAYRESYADAINKELSNVLLQVEDLPAAEKETIVEQFCAPVYEHAKISGMRDVRPELRRFLAVVSNLYRSFVNSNKRASLHVPQVTAPPPLAFFQSDGERGPYTITSESMQKLFATPIAIVSLPATYRTHGLLWCSLAHEVCGHDVVHADPELVPELVNGVRNLFTGDSFAPNGPLNSNLLNALLWSYWIDEAIADVYGVLNMGPTFALNLAAFFSALLARVCIHGGRPVPPLPFLRTSAGPRNPAGGDAHMDEHPVDILRLYLAIGVVESLTHLASETKSRYIDAIKAVAQAALRDKTEIHVQGEVKISHSHWRMVDEKIPLAAAQEAAQKVGGFLATMKLQSLGKHGIQDIETWDDVDEAAAQNTADRILANQSIVGAGDDAQLLAGCNIVATSRPELYEQMSTLLNAGLDESYDRDPIWGNLKPSYVIVPGVVGELNEILGSVERPAHKPGKAAGRSGNKGKHQHSKRSK
jgi:hypothetical protein